MRAGFDIRGTPRALDLTSTSLASGACGTPQPSNERVLLIRQWNEHPILLAPGLCAQLDSIGCTPPDVYGNGRQYRETPCGVVTISGEHIDLAVVSFQRDAPFEEWRRCRLASEIVDIHASPYALPLPVRIATSKVEEARMGFSPTLIEVPNGRLFILNGRSSFLARDDCRVDEAKASRQQVDWAHMPEIVTDPKGVTYFIADA